MAVIYALLILFVYFIVQRVEEIYLSNPSIFSSLEEVLQSDVDSGLARKGDSFSQAVLWLARYFITPLTGFLV